jgi:cyclophilin family peptidyl-prolyl cis-trans isomerase
MRRSKRDSDRADDGDASVAIEMAPVVPLPQLTTGVRCWIRFASADFDGTVTFQLDSATCTNAVANFRFLCEAHIDLAAYKRRQEFLGESKPLPPPLFGSTVSVVRRGEMMEFGTSPTTSYWGSFFKDEWDKTNPVALDRHRRPSLYTHREYTNSNVGTLSMANVGTDTNASRFFITLGEGHGQLDSDHVPFGRVIDGFDVLKRINEAATDPKRSFCPRAKIMIAECGVVDPLAAFKLESVAPAVKDAKLGARRGRETDDVLSGALDVARVRATDDGTVEDARIHSTLAMSSALKKRRGEAADPRFSGALAMSVIDASSGAGTNTQMPTPAQVMRQQQRVYEHDMKDIVEQQRHKKGAAAKKNLKDQHLKQLAAERRSKFRSKKTEKTRFY